MSNKRFFFTNSDYIKYVTDKQTLPSFSVSPLIWHSCKQQLSRCNQAFENPCPLPRNHNTTDWDFKQVQTYFFPFLWCLRQCSRQYICNNNFLPKATTIKNKLPSNNKKNFENKNNNIKTYSFASLTTMQSLYYYSSIKML